MATGDKIVNLDDLKVAYDALNSAKLDKDFSSLDTSGGFSLSDTIPVNIGGSTYKITGQTLSNAIGGGGGTQQASLTNYVKNCGTISVLPVTLTDSNITSDMIVIEYTIGDETALGSDWTVTTADGSLTISGTLNKSTTLQLVLSVGYSTTPSILTNLASDTADNVLKASPRPGVTGVLPLTHGGVGSSTASGARTNLSVYSKSETDSAIDDATEDKAYKVVLSSSEHDTWAKVYAALSSLPSYEAGTLYSGPTASSALTDGKITSAIAGTIIRSGTTVYAIVSSGSTTYMVLLSNITASSRTTSVLYGYRSENITQYITRSDGGTDTIGRVACSWNNVTVELQLGGVALSAGENTVATLSKYYPTWASSSVGYPVACGFIGAGTTIGTPVRCTLDGNGVLKVYASAAVTSTLRVTFNYSTGSAALP